MFSIPEQYNNIIRLLYLAGFLLSVTTHCWAQNSITLKDVYKIEFITTGHFMDNYYSRYVVKPENGKWQCYQTMFRASKDTTQGKIDTIYKKEIKVSYIKTLVSKAAGDTSSVKKIKFVRPDKLVVTNYVDSIIKLLKLNLNPAKRNSYIKDGCSKKYIDRVVHLTFILPTVAAGHSFIWVETQNKDTIKFSGGGNGLYGTPWRVFNKTNYDYKIGEVFNQITGIPQEYESRKIYNMLYKTLFIRIGVELYKKL